MAQSSAPSALLLLAAAGVLLAGCAPQSEPIVIPTREPMPLVSLAEAKQTALDDLDYLLTLMPEGYIEGVEISKTADDIQPCVLGSEDEWRWGGSANFTLTTTGSASFSTAAMAETLADDPDWNESLLPTDELEQDDPILIYNKNGQSGAVWVQTDRGTGHISVLSPCFSLPGGPVTGEEY